MTWAVNRSFQGASHGAEVWGGRHESRALLDEPGLTKASRRRQTASARSSLPLFAAPDAQRSALYSSLYGIDGPVRIYGIDEFVSPLIALPDGVDTGLAVPLPGAEPAELCETPHHRAA
jgi:hypothetical protein